jgi:3-deoxy-D-manno-octulosonate 8-phosphate phosphatase KdsC-like HAD superfamily phosphatase
MEIDYLIQELYRQKVVALEKTLKENDVKMSETAYMGNDIIEIYRD